MCRDAVATYCRRLRSFSFSSGRTVKGNSHWGHHIYGSIHCNSDWNIPKSDRSESEDLKIEWDYIVKRPYAQADSRMMPQKMGLVSVVVPHVGNHQDLAGQTELADPSISLNTCHDARDSSSKSSFLWLTHVLWLYAQIRRGGTVNRHS